MWRTASLILVLGVALLGAALLPAGKALAAATGDVVGGFAAVSNHVTGQLPDASAEGKKVKSPAHFGEVMRTGAESNAVIMLIDGSHMLLGENAEVAIDAFAFDPASDRELARYRLNMGAMRLISGAIKSDRLTITTPNAALAIRGTNVKIRVFADNSTVISVNAGLVEVAAATGGAGITLRAGQSARVDDRGVGDVTDAEAEIDDDFIDDVDLDGDPDLADVELADLGFSDAEIDAIDAAIAEAESEDAESEEAESEDAEGDEAGGEEGSDGSDGGEGGD